MWPGQASVLFPRSGSGGNATCTAVTPCAILDVLTPPYSEPRTTYGRPGLNLLHRRPRPVSPGRFRYLGRDGPACPIEGFTVAGAPYLFLALSSRPIWMRMRMQLLAS